MAETIEVDVEVTQAMIDNGVREDCGKCPIALAIAAALPMISAVKVDEHVAYVNIPAEGHYLTRRLKAVMPYFAQGFVSTFDMCGPGDVDPLSFRLVFKDVIDCEDEGDTDQ